MAWCSNPPDKARDRAELALFQAFFQAGRPILGVCRGMQVINIALGGDLIQDLPPEQKIFHTSCQGDLVHPIFAPEGSVLHQLYGHIFSVNSAHHQAVDRLGEGLRATAWSESGFPEAVELPIPKGWPLASAGWTRWTARPSGPGFCLSAGARTRRTPL